MARRTGLGAAIWFVVAPGSVVGLVPWLLTRWRPGPPFGEGPRWIGAAMVVAGIAALVDAFARFVREGRGTPAPYQLTERLVVSGWYRHVRNPMYVAILSAIVGQALLLGRPVLLAYGAVLALTFHAYVVLQEEPRLRRDFGPSYQAYCRGVPRWLPRLSPWRGGI